MDFQQWMQGPNICLHQAPHAEVSASGMDSKGKAARATGAVSHLPTHNPTRLAGRETECAVTGGGGTPDEAGTEEHGDV